MSRLVLNGMSKRIAQDPSRTYAGVRENAFSHRAELSNYDAAALQRSSLLSQATSGVQTFSLGSTQHDDVKQEVLSSLPLPQPQV